MSAKHHKRAIPEYLEGSSSGKRKKSQESEGRNEENESEDRDRKVFFIFRGVEVWKV